jgi:hypothetical protein
MGHRCGCPAARSDCIGRPACSLAKGRHSVADVNAILDERGHATM